MHGTGRTPIHLENPVLGRAGIAAPVPTFRSGPHKLERLLRRLGLPLETRQDLVGEGLELRVGILPSGSLVEPDGLA
jgi:hypothetical protein